MLATRADQQHDIINSQPKAKCSDERQQHKLDAVAAALALLQLHERVVVAAVGVARRRLVEQRVHNLLVVDPGVRLQRAEKRAASALVQGFGRCARCSRGRARRRRARAAAQRRVSQARAARTAAGPVAGRRGLVARTGAGWLDAPGSSLSRCRPWPGSPSCQSTGARPWPWSWWFRWRRASTAAW